MSNAKATGSKHTHSQKRSGGVWRFVRRNYKWVAVLGSFIISVTLGARDHFLEREKEVVSSIEASKASLRIQELIGSTNDRIEQVREVVFGLQLGLFEDKKDPSYKDDTSFMYRRNSQFRELSLTIEKLDEMVQLASDGKHGELTSALTLLKGDFSKADRERLAQWSHPKLGVSGALVPDRAEAFQLSRQTEDITTRADSLMAKTETRLEEQRTKYQRLAVLYSWLSYLLIALGVSLSLLGKAFEPETENSVEAEL